DRAVVAETLLDGTLGELRPRAELRQLRRMLDERPEAVADQADRRLEAGDEKADRLRDELGWAETVALLLGPDERAHEIVDDALDVAAQCGDRPRCEGAAHETTETGVRRRILLEHELALPAERLVDPGQDAVRGARAGGHLVQQPVDVGVAREAPEADRREVHRLDFAQPTEARVRIVAERRIERVTAAPRIVRAHRAASLCAGIT